MVVNQTTSLGAEFEDRETRGVIDIDRSTLKGRDLGSELEPLVLVETTRLDLVACDLAHVLEQTVDKLQFRHLEREYSHGYVVIDTHVLDHRKREGCLTHCRTGCHDDEVGGLPSACHLVEVVEACRKSRETIGTVGCLFDLEQCFLNHGVDLDDAIADIAL